MVASVWRSSSTFGSVLDIVYSLPFRVTAPADRNAPRKRVPQRRANIISTKPSICRLNFSPYPYHQTFLTEGKRSESKYLMRTISSSPKRPCARQTAGLHPAMRRLADAEARHDVVDHDRPGMNTSCQGFSARAIACPNAGCQAELGIICETYSFVIGVERHHRQDGPECFIPHDAHLVIYIREHSRCVEVRSEITQPKSTYQNARAKFYRIFDVRLHSLKLPFVNQWPNVRVWIGSVADLQQFHLRDARIEKWLIQTAMYVTPFYRKTSLAGIHECAPDCARGCHVDISIVQHQHRIFAT